MSDEATVTEETVNKKAADIRSAIAEKLAASGPEVQAAVVKVLTDKELDARAQLILQGMGKLDELNGQLRKVKPDQVIMGEDGQPTTQGYSPQKFGERKKLLENVGKIEKGIELALSDNPNYDPLKKALGQKGDKGKQGND